MACAFNLALDAGDEAGREVATAGLIKAYGEDHPILADAAAGLRLETDIDPPPL